MTSKSVPVKRLAFGTLIPFTILFILPKMGVDKVVFMRIEIAITSIIGGWVVGGISLIISSFGDLLKEASKFILLLVVLGTFYSFKQSEAPLSNPDASLFFAAIISILVITSVLSLMLGKASDIVIEFLEICTIFAAAYMFLSLFPLVPLIEVPRGFNGQLRTAVLGSAIGGASSTWFEYLLGLNRFGE